MKCEKMSITITKIWRKFVQITPHRCLIYNDVKQSKDKIVKIEKLELAHGG